MAGQLWTWGDNYYGQIGDNTIVTKSSPVQTITYANNWTSLAGSTSHFAGLKTDGTLWLWGWNSNGQLGNNSTSNISSPVQTVTTGTNWNYISCGLRHTAAIKTDGTLWIWGYNYYGQLGDNTIIDKSSPIQSISFGTNWRSVACGGVHTSAIKTDGSLWSWGYNYYGQLGNNKNNHTSSPVQTIAGGNNWNFVACGNYHTAAIKTDGTLWAWGYNSYGQIGDNTLVHKSSPIQTTTYATNWTSVSCGQLATAGIKTDGTLWLWGRNSYGQLGDNTITHRSSPVQTTARGNTWNKVSAGYVTSATKKDGTLWVWGRNNQGALGINATGNRSSPVQTVMLGSSWSNVSTASYNIAAIYENTPSALSITTQPANAYNAQKITQSASCSRS